MSEIEEESNSHCEVVAQEISFTEMTEDFVTLRTSGELCSNLSASPFLSRLGEAD